MSGSVQLVCVRNGRTTTKEPLLRKILAVAAAAAFIGTAFSSMPASADCVEVRSGDPYLVADTVVGSIWLPGFADVDTNPQDCITAVRDVLNV